MAIKARAEITLSSIRDIQSVTRYYLLQSSTAAKPNKPTTNPPGGSWVKAEPTYTTGSTNSLYFTDCTVFSDGTFVYSDVSLSSSYEAAKVAYNKAENAEDIANDASDKVDNLEVGGRNLLPGTKTFSHWYTNYPQSITFHGGIMDIADTASAQWRFVASPSIKFSDVEGKDITVSMDIRSDDYEELATQTYPLVGLYLKNRGPEACNYTHRVRSAPSFKLSTRATSEWTRISFTHNNISVDTFTNKYAEGDAPWLSLGFWFYTKNSFQVRNIKMETGNIPTDWTEAPEDIEAEVNAAQETANGKNTVYYQTSAPTGGTYKTNDIWFDTGNGNKMYMWNGSAWTPEQFGNAAISDLSITNAKIANGTIESAKISNLDAGKVTSGTMSAARIKGDELKLGGDNNTDGVMKVYNADGELVGSFTKEGLEVIAGQIGGWGIFSQVLKNEWDLNLAHYRALLSPKEGLWLDETSLDQGMDPNGVYLNKVEYGLPGIIFTLRREINGAVRTGSSSIMGTFYDPDNEKGGIALGPHVIVEDDGADDPSTIDVSELYLKSLEDNSYVRQPQLIMKGNVVVKNGSTNKNVVLCTIPTAYQSGYYIVPFVTRTFGGTGVPDDAGDFKYAYYNQTNYTVNLKLFNNLTSGVWYDYVYFIYALPKT